MYVENDDASTCINPTIGIQSILTYTSSISAEEIAGWFQAPNSINCYGGLAQCAIFVPQNGGTVLIGAPATFPLPLGGAQTVLSVYGDSYDNGSSETELGTSGENIAIQGYAQQSMSFGSNEIAILGVANNNQSSGYFNIGVEAVANGTTASGVSNYGIYAIANVNPTDWAGYFVGGVYSTSGLYYPSDSKLKTDIDSISNGDAESILSSLKPYSYLYDQTNNPAMGLPNGTHYGFLAQDLEKVLPNLVRSARQPDVMDSTGKNVKYHGEDFKAVNYIEIIPILVKGYQDMQNKYITQKTSFDSLKNVVQSMQNCLNQICSATSSGNPNSNTIITNVQNVSLSSTDAPLLYQNTPNPFSTGTKINYYLPQGTMSASIVFYDNYGNTIKQVELSQTGNGTLSITPDNLNNGIYSYSLIVKGNVIDTKRMVLQK